ncbi:hypothetical protein DSECCO2_152300 [anaerobic digester metagenome]
MARKNARALPVAGCAARELQLVCAEACGAVCNAQAAKVGLARSREIFQMFNAEAQPLVVLVVPEVLGIDRQTCIEADHAVRFLNLEGHNRAVVVAEAQMIGPDFGAVDGRVVGFGHVAQPLRVDVAAVYSRAGLGDFDKLGNECGHGVLSCPQGYPRAWGNGQQVIVQTG